MHTKEFFTKEGAQAEWSIDEREKKEEQRQHKHVYELRHKSSEKPRNLRHFNHKLSVTKLRIIFFSHKYLIFVTKHHI